MNHKMIYQTLLNRKLQKFDFNFRIERFIIIYRKRCDVFIIKSRVWVEVRNEFGNSRIEDLFWRFLYQKIKTKSDLFWILMNLQRCFMYRIDLIYNHIWIECSITKAIWKEFVLIWKSLKDIEMFMTRSMIELIVFIMICSK